MDLAVSDRRFFGEERERFFLQLIDDVRRGLADVEAGRTQEAHAAIARLQRCRAAVVASEAAEKRG